jgi:hypothetical protein
MWCGWELRCINLFFIYLHQAIEWRSNFEPTCGWCDDDNETAATAMFENTLWFARKTLKLFFLFKKLVVSIIDDGIDYYRQLEKFVSSPAQCSQPSALLIYDSLLFHPPLYLGFFFALQACSGTLE